MAVIENLIKKLEHAGAFRRLLCIIQLGDLRESTAIEPLISVYRKGGILTRRVVIKALRKIAAGNSIEPFFNALKDKDSNIRKEMAAVLDKTGWKPSNTTEQAFYFAARQEWHNLAAMGEDALEPLIMVQKDEDAGIRKKAAETLGLTEHPGAVKPLANALKDEDVEVRRAAVKSLFKIGSAYKQDVRPIIHLFSATKDFHFRVYQKAEEVLRTLCTFSLEPLIDALNNKDLEIRIVAAKLLGRIKDNRAVEPLTLLLKDDCDDVSIEAARALGNIKDVRAVEPLIDALTGSYQEVIIEAVRALAEIKDSRALRPLIQALNHPSPLVQIEAVTALGKIGNMRAVQRIRQKIKRIKNWPARDKAMLTLGRLGDADALEYLVKIKGRHAKEAKRLLDKICSITPDEGRQLVCEKCFCRAEEHKPVQPSFSQWSSDVSALLKYRYLTYYACRNCHENIYLTAGIKTLVLLLDHGSRKKTVRSGTNREIISVNWFKREKLFDYDEIHIKDADDFEVEELLLKLRNDMDDERRNRLKDIPVYLSPRLKLSPAKTNLIKDNFNIQVIMEA